MSNPPINRAQRRKLQTRQKLIDSTTRLLAAESYETLTVKAITDDADVGYGTFYLHFTDKDDVVWQATASLIADGNEQLKTQFAHLPPLEREFESLKLWFEIAKFNKKNMLTVIGRSGSPVLSGRYKDAIIAINEQNLSQIPNLEAALGVPLEFAANFLSGAILHLTAWWLENDLSYTPQQMAEKVFQLLGSWHVVESMRQSETLNAKSK